MKKVYKIPLASARASENTAATFTTLFMNNEKFASDEKVPLSTQFPDLPHVEWGYNPGSGMMRVRNGKTQTEITRWIGTHRSSIGTYVTMLMEELGVQPPEFRPVDMPENAPAVVETDSDSQKA